MTEYDWNEMTAREKDALVAREVMGWEYRESPFDGPSLHEGWLVPGRTYPMYEAPEFTTDITAAWRVVKKMDDDEFGFCLDDFCPPGERTHYSAEFGDNFDHGLGEAQEAPEAICLAALRAKGVDV